jgi:ABC-type nitrate/sulfonate/bicarbonate transport system permease component
MRLRRSGTPHSAAAPPPPSVVEGGGNGRAPTRSFDHLRLSPDATVTAPGVAQAMRYTSGMSATGDIAAAADPVAPPRAGATRARTSRALELLIPVLSIVVALAIWELISRGGLIEERDLPSMTSSFGELWSMIRTSDFWIAFGQTARGWAIGLGLATLLAVPLGIALGSSEFAARAFRVPIEFLRPIPSAALIPLLFLTLGTTLESEIFLATFGAFWPLLVQTMYGVHDVDPIAIDTARSFDVPRHARLIKITLPSAVPYVMTGLRIASTVALILAFTAELFMGTGGLGKQLNYYGAFGLNTSVYAIALAIGFLGVAIHYAMVALERRVLRWHPSQRTTEAALR